MPSLSTAFLWIVGSLLGLYFFFSEFLDLIGRLEIIERKWPRIWALLSNRPMRLILSAFLLLGCSWSPKTF